MFMHRPGETTHDIAVAVALSLLLLLFMFSERTLWAAEIAAPFFPLHSGNRFTYLENGLSPNTSTVLPGTISINGSATVAIQESDGFTAYYTNDYNGIRLHRQVDPASNLTVTFSPPIVFAPATTNFEVTTDSSGTAFTSLGAFAYTASFTVHNFETVTVPLRSFQALRVTGTISITGGGSASLDIHLARNVGMVRLVESEGGQTIISELSATNVTPKADYDGDVRADVGFYRDGVWNIWRSSDSGITVEVNAFGPLSEPLIADFDGDGKGDFAVHNNGYWALLWADGRRTVIQWSGTPGDIPVPADYDGDGKADLAVYNSNSAGWSIIRSSDSGLTYKPWGGPAWQPVVADYDGDGKADIAVYNPIGLWSIVRSSDGGNTLFGWSGAANDIPVPADYDGDGKTDFAIYNTSTAWWSIIRSSDFGLSGMAWGGPGWEPVVADYDGDGKADIAVYNPTYGVWSIVHSFDGGNTLLGWGGGGQNIPLN